MSRLTLPLAAALIAASAAARADSYPVAGFYTYENASDEGAAKTCGQRRMQFAGNIRHDTGTSVPDYKNVSVRLVGKDTWSIVDEFFNLRIRGRVIYTLQTIDEDHIRLTFEKGGSSPLLRRCSDVK